MHVHVFPSFPLIFLSKKKGIGAHFFHMTQGFLTWCYPKPFFCSGASEMLQDCGREVALSASREGNSVLWLPKVSRGGSPLPRAGREIPRSMVTVIFTMSAYLCCSSSAPRWRPVPRAGLNWEVYGEKSDLPFWGQSLWTEADTSWALMACLPE